METAPLLQKALRRLRRLLGRARRAGLREPVAFALSTATPAGRPSSRMVLLKAVDERGLVFYTNFSSRKGRELAANPRAAACFYWDMFLEQVRLEGKVERVRDEEADAYWKSRHRDSQLSAWASEQSRTLPSRAVLLARVARLKRVFAGKEIPRPRDWGGYRLVPDAVEFWKAGPHRLNHRELFERKGLRWTRRLLYP